MVKEGKKWKRVGPKDQGPYRNTIWSVNWLPLGGFVRIKGEQADGVDDPDSFHAKAAWKRMLILAAGVCMNWLLAFVLFATVFMIGTNAVIEDLPSTAIVRDASVRITQVLTDSPADAAGLHVNDVILAVGGVAPKDWQQAKDLIASHDSTTFPIRVKRDNATLDVQTTPAYVKSLDRVAIGIGMADVGVVRFKPLDAIWAAARTTGGYTKLVLVTFWELGRDLVTRKPVTTEIAGPVGIAVMTGEIAQQGIIPLLQFAAILSINLAVVNFLPIPALDGGRVLFLAIEKVRRKPMNRNLEAAIHNIVFLILIGVIVLVTIRDLSVYGGGIVLGLRKFVGI
jgi:regulator of sigma E protease